MQRSASLLSGLALDPAVITELEAVLPRIDRKSVV